MFRPMPSPKGSNHEGLFVPAKFVRSPVVAAYDAIGGLTSRRLAAPANAPAKKPAVDGPSRQEGLQAILDFLSGALPSDLFAEVQAALEQYVHGSQERDTAYAPAADRRRLAGDSAGDQSFFARFPSARKIGAV